MGEARRKRLRAGRSPPPGTIEYTDVVSGDSKLARNAGGLDEFLARRAKIAIAVQNGLRPVAEVACAGCTACCYYQEITFDPTKERPEDLAHLDVIEVNATEVRLKERADGACVHLGETGCTVYEHRPLPCRVYDCRDAALISMVETYKGDRHSPVWIFDCQTKRDRILQVAFQMLGLAYQSKAAKEGKARSVEATLNYAFRHIEKAVSALETLASLPTDRLTQLLGFDPRGVPQEEYSRVLKQVYAGLQKALENPVGQTPH